MAGKNSKTAGEAARPANSSPTATAPAAGQEGQGSTAADATSDGEGDKAEEPDYRALYEETRSQVQQLMNELHTVTGERDEARELGTRVEEQLVQAQADLQAATNPDVDADFDFSDEEADDEEEADEEEKPYDEAEIKDVLKRNGLKKAWVLPSGDICFEQKYALHVAGADFDTLTVISAE